MMKCSKCNKSFPDGVVFCEVCGDKLVPEVQNAAPTPANTNYYTPPAQQYTPPSQNLEPVTIGEWMVNLVYLIPCVGPLIWLILMFVWAFGGNTKESKKTFAKAALIITLIVFVLAIIIWIILIAGGISFMDIMRNSYYY